MESIIMDIVQCFIFQRKKNKLKKKNHVFQKLIFAGGHTSKISSLTLESYWLKNTISVITSEISLLFKTYPQNYFYLGD